MKCDLLLSMMDVSCHFHVSSSNRCSSFVFFANEMLENYLRAYTYENQSRKCDFMLLCIKQMKKNCKEASFSAKISFCCLCMQLEREKLNIVIRTFTIKFSFFASKRIVISTSSSSHDKFINVKHQILNNLIC